jgi:predicted negative regulator of RcsB-dependent stress response
MAQGTPPSSGPEAPQRGGGSSSTSDDAFTTRVLLFVAWAQRNPQTLIGSVIGIVLVVVGVLWFTGQRSGQLAAAAAQLEQVQQTVAFAPAEEAIAELERYLVSFGRTPYGLEARLLLGERFLEAGDPQGAIEALKVVAPSFGDPLRTQATVLLAVAYEQAEDWASAIRTYQDLKDRAEMTFQRQEATEGLARAQLALGDTAAAIAAYQALLDSLDEGDLSRSYLEMRLAELGYRP